MTPRPTGGLHEAPWEVRGTRPGSDDSLPDDARPVSAGPPRQTSGRPTALNEPMPRLSGDRYDLLRRLGSGGMADVYLACDLVLEREVAIKVLRNAVQNRDLLNRFHREAVALAALRSEHVVSVLDVAVRADVAYLVMEYLPGQSLSRLLATTGPLPAERAIRILGQLLDGLEYLHRHDFVHRDVKPDNILIDDDDRAVLVDLGIVFDQRRPGLTPANFVAGTPSYMAPEQRICTAVDCRIDLYQAGLVALFALTGIEPGSLGQPIDQIALASAMASVDAPIAAVVYRALSIDAAERYPSARDMKRALEDAVGGTGRTTRRDAVAGDATAALASEPPRLGTPRRAGRRNGVLAAVVALTMATGGVALHRTAQATDPAGSRAAWASEPLLTRALAYEQTGAIEPAIGLYRSYLRHSPDGLHADAVRSHVLALEEH